MRICNRIIRLVPSDAVSTPPDLQGHFASQVAVSPMLNTNMRIICEQDKKRIDEEREASMRLVQLAAADE